jgi:hypothetical protein
MAPRIVNLDELIPENAQVIFKGEHHDVIPASTEMYLHVLKSRDKLKSANQEVEQVEQSILLIRLCAPTIPEIELRKLPLRALMALTHLVEEMMEEINEGEKPKDAEEDSLGE